ncbi:diguanylate cyclase [Azohydromonas aeria]|uniref:diguanylate cyclase n=1 Tax=Azohydromonas aeria TaxID=2590212 RepID=UPI0012F7EF8E|nr:diguanylate cyclase [Azohydromonas aeria]
MTISASVAPLSLWWVNGMREQQQQQEQRLLSLRRAQELLLDAETGQRGFVITGREEFLQPYYAAMQYLPDELQHLEHRYARQEQAQRGMVQVLLGQARLKLQELAETVRLRRTEGFTAVEPVVASARGKHHMDEVRRIASDLNERGALELAQANADLRFRMTWAVVFSVVSTLLTLCLAGYLFKVTRRTMQQREVAAQRAHRISEKLASGMTRLQRHNEELRTLGEMSRAMQADMTLLEELEVASLFCARLLPETSGAIYLFRNSADQLELAARWGAGPSPCAVMAPSACWGLRLGQVHRSGGSAAELRCLHCHPAPANTAEVRLCLPLTAYGEVLGLMHVQGVSASVQDDETASSMEAMARAIAEQAALSLSNAKLRQTLRDQSIKEPLTGLFNRRYMEETLRRELLRAQRNDMCVSVVMMDLDHFKKINDTYGHPVGDAVLCRAAQYIASVLRASDVACRWGGEEFALVLMDCDRDAAMVKAQQLCDGLRNLTVLQDGHAINVTASFGVASSSTDAQEPEGLVAAADHALYTAKRAGRDRVAAAVITQSRAIPEHVQA